MLPARYDAPSGKPTPIAAFPGPPIASTNPLGLLSPCAIDCIGLTGGTNDELALAASIAPTLLISGPPIEEPNPNSLPPGIADCRLTPAPAVFSGATEYDGIVEPAAVAVGANAGVAAVCPALIAAPVVFPAAPPAAPNALPIPAPP